jgi:DNA-binding response OmpR family regulator
VANKEGVTMARILIVEDDRSFADALADMLRLEGHEALIAVDPDEGIRLGLLQQPDLVIADWMLTSDLHGGEVCRRIRAGCPRVKTIIITGYLDVVPEIGRWSEYGETVIQKPFHKGEIVDAVNRALSGTCCDSHPDTEDRDQRPHFSAR